MAKEILIRFGTRNLDRARDVAKQMAGTIKDALKAVKDPDLRRRLREEAKVEAKLDREAIADRQREINYLQSAGRRRTAPGGDLDDLRTGFSLRQRKGMNLVRRAVGGTLDPTDLAFDVAKDLPGVLGGAAFSVEQIYKLVQDAVKSEIKLAAVDLENKLNDRLKEIDLEKRLKTDEELIAAAGAEALSEIRAEAVAHGGDAWIADGDALGEGN